MPITETEQNRALYFAQRAYLYSLFHLVFGTKPTADTLNSVMSSDTQAVVSTFATSAQGTLGEGTALKNLAQLIEKRKAELTPEYIGDLASDYMSLFQVPGKSYVYPWESPYLTENNMMMQESTIDVRDFYHKAGFKLQAEKHFPDDHIAAMMDFMGRLSQRVYEAYADGADDEVAHTLDVQELFIQKHIFTWLDDFVAKVIEKPQLGDYEVFALALQEFIKLDARAMTEMK